MITIKNLGITTGLITGIGGTSVGILYSTGLFDSSAQITKLLEKENKHILLSIEENELWTNALASYKENPTWGKIVATGDDLEKKELQSLCLEKSKKNTYGTSDKAYLDVIKYCAREKTIKDVLGKNFKLLDTSNNVDKWKNRFDNYKAESNKLKLPDVNVEAGDTKENNHSKLSTGCKNAINKKTTDIGYENTLEAVKKWCKSEE